MKWSTNRAAAYLASREMFQGVVQNGRFYKEEGGAREKIVAGQDHFFWGEGNGRVFITHITSLALIGKFQIDF